MAYGDHVFVRRRGYTHHGVEVAGGMVVHFSGTPGSKRDATIRRDTLDAFANGGRSRRGEALRETARSVEGS